MKKSSKAHLVIVFFAAVFLGLVLTSLTWASQNQNAYMGPGQESVSLNFGNITQANGYYHVPLTVQDKSPTKIDKIEISPAGDGTSETSQASADLTVTVNGTAINIVNPLNYKLNSGDSLQISFLLPTSQYASNTTITATVYATKAMYYAEAQLP